MQETCETITHMQAFTLDGSPLKKFCSIHKLTLTTKYKSLDEYSGTVIGRSENTNKILCYEDHSDF